jgi:hypothetical protein
MGEARRGHGGDEVHMRGDHGTRSVEAVKRAAKGFQHAASGDAAR